MRVWVWIDRTHIRNQAQWQAPVTPAIVREKIKTGGFREAHSPVSQLCMAMFQTEERPWLKENNKMDSHQVSYVTTMCAPGIHLHMHASTRACARMRTHTHTSLQSTHLYRTTGIEQCTTDQAWPFLKLSVSVESLPASFSFSTTDRFSFLWLWNSDERKDITDGSPDF